MRDLVQRATTEYGLTEKQARFVVEYCKRGNVAGAARAAPYDASEGRKLIQENPGAQAAISDLIQGLYLQDRVRARKIALDLAEKAESEKVRLDAAKFLEERGGGKAAEMHYHQHHHAVDRQSLHREIRRLQEELGLNQTIDVEVNDAPPSLSDSQ